MDNISFPSHLRVCGSRLKTMQTAIAYLHGVFNLCESIIKSVIQFEPENSSALLHSIQLRASTKLSSSKHILDTQPCLNTSGPFCNHKDKLFPYSIASVENVLSQTPRPVVN